MRLRDRLPNYMKLEDVANYSGAPDYIIDKVGSYFVAFDTTLGTAYKDTDYATLVQKVIDELVTSGDGAAGLSVGAWIHNKFGYAEVSTPINLNEGCRFTGNSRGYGTCLELADGVNEAALKVCVPTNYHATIENIDFQGNKANNGGMTDALVICEGYTIMRDCYVMNAKKNGVYLNGQDQHMQNVYVEYCDDNAWKIESAQNTHLLQCTAYSCLGHGVLSSCDRGSIMGCRIMISTKDGIYLNSTTNLSIIGNHFELNGLHGIYGGTSSFNNISGNAFVDNSQTTDNTYNAIELVGCTYNTIIGNSVSGTGALANHKYGVSETGGANAFNEICGNTIFDTGTGTYLLDANKGSSVNGTGTESANAETPTLAWPFGTIVKFTDSGDASGNGTYLRDSLGNWVKLA